MRQPRSGGRARAARLAVVFASAELAPLAQTGGLGDAVAGLARALVARGHAVTCLVPGHRAARESAGRPPLRVAESVRLASPGGELVGRWLEGELEGVGLCLLDLPGAFDAPGLYGSADDVLRFGAFSRAVAAWCVARGPDVLVAHDWHAALAITALRTLHPVGPGRRIGCVQVVHNGAYTGRFGAASMAATGLPGELFQPDGLEFHGDLCLLKGGLLWAERIATVSPRYAQELQTPAFGAGLEGVYRHRAHRLEGIANGIDAERWNPAQDAALAERFDARHPARREPCRAALLEALGLAAPVAGRLLGAIGRFSEQKGWDVLADCLPELVARGASLALLGDGDAEIGARLEAAAARHPDRVAVRRGWDGGLARRIYAGVDALLVPSRFEPCGLVQLLAQRYGALPIGHAVGGLVDTLIDGDTGILFAPLSERALLAAVERGVSLFEERGARALSRRLLGLDVSWREPARRWETLLLKAAAEGRSHA